MVDIGKTLYVWQRQQWREWLAANHQSEPEIWLVLHTKASGKPSLSYADSVEEALCFGWIDSIVKKHGPESRAQRFTPRRRGSPLSEMNKVRVIRLQREGLMTPAGLAAIDGAFAEPYQAPADIVAAIQSNEAAWRHFQTFSEDYVRIRLGWIDTARARPDVFQQRLDYFIEMTAQGKQFGSVR